MIERRKADDVCKVVEWEMVESLNGKLEPVRQRPDLQFVSGRICDPAKAGLPPKAEEPGTGSLSREIGRTG